MRVVFADTDLASVERYKAVRERKFVAWLREHIRADTRPGPRAHARTRTDANAGCIDFDILARP